MEKPKIKCSFTGHEEIDAIVYCLHCKINMCNKCETFHSKLCKNHLTTKIENNIEEIFTGFCKEKNHYNELDYFCKNHNELCCAACLCKINNKGFGKHKDCKVVNLEEIKDEKMDKLKDNINLLEELSKTLDESTNKIKNVLEKMNSTKEELKMKIQKIFTKIRNEINNREDFLLSEIDKQFENNFLNENILKECEKLPSKIKLSLEMGKAIDKEKELDDNLSSLIFKCINIENNIKEINLIKENMKKSDKFFDVEIDFTPEEKEIDNFLDKIKKFGNIIFGKKSLLNYDLNKKDLIINWIKEKTNKNSVKFELIFRMSENGSKSSDFHKYCDNKGPTLTIIKTTKNKIFGGFTPLDWKDKGREIIDESNQTFIFSLNLEKKYDMIKKGGCGIYCTEEYGPIFAYDFGLKEDMKKGDIYARKESNFLPKNNLELTGGKGEHENFEVEEFEVYKTFN